MGEAKLRRMQAAVISAAMQALSRMEDKERAEMWAADLVEAVEALKEAAPKFPGGALPFEPLPINGADPNAFTCPVCSASRPSYGWHFNIGDTGPFALQWMTCFCGECKTILGVTVIQFMPKQELVE